MRAYKGFEKNLTCRGYQFLENSINKYTTKDNAKCVSHGFHCAENPLDCLTYYPNMNQSVYYVVEATGDIHEDGSDSKLSCTELKLIKKLSIEEFVYCALIFVAKHPERDYGRHIKTDEGISNSKEFVIVRGKNPKAKGPVGSVLGLIQEYKKSNRIKGINFFRVDGEKIKADFFYNIDEVIV